MGNLPASILNGGASPVFSRNESDFYPTPRECTAALFDAWDVPDSVWEPACGDGAIARVCEEYGRAVTGTDLHDRGYGRGGVDFLRTVVCPAKCIITNPPFFLAARFIEHAASFEVPFAMLLKATFWNAKSRRKLFISTGPAAVLPLTWRPNFDERRGRSPTMDVVWTVWGSTPARQCEFRPLLKPAYDVFG